MLSNEIIIQEVYRKASYHSSSKQDSSIYTLFDAINQIFLDERLGSTFSLYKSTQTCEEKAKMNYIFSAAFRNWKRENAKKSKNALIRRDIKESWNQQIIQRIAAKIMLKRLQNILLLARKEKC